MPTKHIEVDPAVDEHFEDFLEELQAANPHLFEGRFSLKQEEARQLLKTTYTLGFVAGEANAITKINAQ